MTITELDSRVAELRELQRTIEELSEQAEAIRDSIRAKMVEEGCEELTGNGWKATWHTVTSSRLDAKKLKAENPALYAEYCKSSTACRFTLA